MEIDETDRKIINVLLSDSRLSFRQVAKKVGVSVATVMNRVRSLEKGGVIRGYNADIDYDKLGYDIDVIININVSKGKLLQVEGRIAASENIVAVYDVTGDYDAVVIGRFRNRRSLDAFLKKIQTYDFVERTNTVVILNTIKNRNMQV